jgi:hypothetical protein
MKKKIILSESDLVKLVRNVISEQRQYLSRLFGNSVDDIIKMFGDDAAKSLDDVFAKLYSKQGNLANKPEGLSILSAKGSYITVEDTKYLISLVGQGKYTADEVLNYFPRYLADGTEFRSVLQQAMLKKGKPTVSQAVSQGIKQLSEFEKKHLLKDCFHPGYCNKKQILSDFYRKINNTVKLSRFDPSKVRIREKSNVAGRQVIEVTLEDGTDVLFYKSSGANVATTGKEAGEWFVIPGFAEDGWFFKTEETIGLTKGLNLYLTEMAEFLKQNGVS